MLQGRVALITGGPGQLFPDTDQMWDLVKELNSSMHKFVPWTSQFLHL